MDGTLGPLLLIAAAVLGYRAYREFVTAHQERESWISVLGTDPTPLPELVGMADAVDEELGSAVRFSREVTVTGIARPAADRQTKSPVSGADCVWYSLRRERRTVSRTDSGDSTDLQVEHVQDSGGHFVLAGDGAQILIDVSNNEVRSVPSAQRVSALPVNTFQGFAGVRSIEEVLTERFIPVGTLLTVAGAAKATASGVELSAPAGGVLVMTVETRSQLLAARQGDQLLAARLGLRTAIAAAAALLALVLGIIFW